MSFHDLSINCAYDTGLDDPLNDFYLPVLSQAIKYDRIAGYFSSSSLAIAARGIGGFIANDGKMRIIASPRLSQEDIDVIRDASENSEIYLGNILSNELDNYENEFQRDHIRALGWMLANGYLSLKLALVMDNKYIEENKSAIFHQKVGVLTDKDGECLSFSGSLNETAMGWLENIEEFKVFKKWESGQSSYYSSDANKFEAYWNGTVSGVKVINAPDAVIQKLTTIGREFSKDTFSLREYLSHHKKVSIDEKLNLFSYQKKALDEWVQNDHKLLFEMATGTGKTRTSLACINTLLKNEKKLVCIIACPQTTLSRQWKREIEEVGLKFDECIIVDGTNSKWRPNLEVALQKISVGYKNTLVIYTTHITSSKNDFIDIITKFMEIPICFVGDEVHGLGAYKTKQALLDIYKYRIGLSATPKRWFDDCGTTILENYFGDKSFEFTIFDALSTINPRTGKTFLVQYYYHPVFVHLTDDELINYMQLSRKISKLSKYVKNSDEYQKNYESLLFSRAKITKSAANKYDELDKILNEIKKEKKQISDTLIFTDDNQIDEVMRMMKNHSILAHRFTQAEGTKPESCYRGSTERQDLIQKFKENAYNALVAIKCLDEGIDIPSASTAILMASSTNPREYIQRIGRVIRQDENKPPATIYDFVVVPDFKKLKIYPELCEFETHIFQKEMIRVKAISKDALNNADILIKINEVI
jgi:superfamily II DNA or RNA helicase